MKSKIAALILIAAIGIVISASFVQAKKADASYSWTMNSAMEKDWIFSVGERIYIGWHPIPDEGTVDIYVKDAAGQLVPGASWQNLAAAESGSIWFQPTAAGKYSIYCTGTDVTVVEVRSVLHTPESPLGTISVVVAGVVALGAFGLVRSRKKRA
ncbi:MAG: hypothetical protein ACE14S_02060 [Candidatus Bathyarchaeia archaeon]